MASSILTAFPILLLILFHLLLATDSVSVPTRTTQTGFHFRANMTRASSSNASNESLVNANIEDVYTMTLAIGTPPVHIRSVVMDTGSDVIWIKCNSNSNFPSTFFDTSMSSSYSKVDDESCESLGLPGCQQKYANGMSVNLSFGKETLTTWGKEHPGVIFACGIPSNSDFEYDGIVGLGRGKLSLVSQVNLPSFLYCMPGSNASINYAFPDIKNVQIMPLLEQEGKSYYYISLEGISVGETRLPVTNVDFAINANGDGGMIIDSGTEFTFLDRRIVDMIYDEFLNQTKLKMYDGDQAPFSDLENCFTSPYNVEIIPKLVFHFKGVFPFEGANWELPSEYYIYEKDGVACLGIIANPDNETVSIFGYMQQQSMLVTYDLDQNYLVFMPKICN